jgi:hypothetical protein
MRTAAAVGILLILIGIAGFAMDGISFSHEKKDVDLGPLQVSHREKSTIPIAPILSTLSLVGWIVLVVAGVRSKQRCSFEKKVAADQKVRSHARISSKNGVRCCCTHSAAYRYMAADQVCQSRPLGLPVCA